MSDELETGWARYRLPILMTGGLALYGASRFDGTRPVAGLLLTYGFPLIALGMGAAPMRESSLAGAAFGVGAAAALAAELAIGRAMSPESELFQSMPPLALAVVSLLALGGAALVQARAAGRGMRNNLSAWIGMVTALSLYLPSHVKVGRDALDAFVAALLVSLFVGGGLGLALGAIVTRLLPKAPEPRRTAKKEKP